MDTSRPVGIGGPLGRISRPIPEAIRSDLNRRKQMWIDLEKKERSDFGNELGEVVAQYLKRYGVRLSRVRA